MVAYINSELFPKYWLPGNINVGVYGYANVLFGYLLKELKLQINGAVLVLAIFITVITVIYFKNNYSLEMKYSRYGIPGLSLIASGTIVYLMMKGSIFLERVPGRVILVSIGRVSLTIMFFHQFFRLTLINLFNMEKTLVKFF